MPAPTSRISACSRVLFVALPFCVVMGAAVAQARFRVMTAAELSLGGSWLRHGPDEFAARKPLLTVFAVVLGGALWLIFRLLLRRLSGVMAAILCGSVSLAVAAQQTYSVREARVQRLAFLRTMHRLEGTAAPGEVVIVENPRLLLQLRWYAGNGFRQQLTHEVGARNRLRNEEAIFVGRLTGGTGSEFKNAGFALREDGALLPEDVETLRMYAGEGTSIYFVTAATEPAAEDAAAVS